MKNNSFVYIQIMGSLLKMRPRKYRAWLDNLAHGLESDAFDYGTQVAATVPDLTDISWQRAKELVMDFDVQADQEKERRYLAKSERRIQNAQAHQ